MSRLFHAGQKMTNHRASQTCVEGIGNVVRVTFTKTHERGYSVSVDGPGIKASTMNPAPGYDDRLPHDVAHFIVEDELQIAGGVFGQLAAGGSFRILLDTDSRKSKAAKKRRDAIAKSNKEDALFAEHAVYAAQSRWEKHDIIPSTKIPDADIARITERFNEFAEQWSGMNVGDSVVMEWTSGRRATQGR